MKKVLFMPVLLMLITGLVMMGCDSGTTTPGPGPGPATTVKVLKVTFSEDWAGIDLMDSVFTFAANDKIEAKGKILAVAGTGPELVFNDKPGGWGTVVYQKQNIAAGDEWVCDASLTSAMITNIASVTPKAIRIQGNSVTANTLVMTFEQLKVTRGTTVLLDLAEHLQTFEVGAKDIGLILPGTKGFQKAGNITVEVIAK